jgi:class 3 adenylate cyclase
MAAPKSNFERKLLTILSADVVGYSRLMAEQEERTLEIFIGHKKVFEAQVAEHKGRIFNTAGDAILAEFPSAVEGLRCAIVIQEKLWELNKTLPASQAVNFRIGLNIGDVMVQGTDLMGDGVNIAARVQTAAMPGGVCISGSLHDQIQGKLTVPLIFAGEKVYKNIPHPVRTYAVKFAGRAEMKPQLKAAMASKNLLPGRGWGFEIVVGLILLGMGGFVYSTKVDGLQLSGAVCMGEYSSVPAELLDESLTIGAEKLKVLKAGLQCTTQMKCFSQWQPWLRLAMQASDKETPFTTDSLFVENGQGFAAFLAKDHSTIHFRAMKQEGDGGSKFSRQECMLSVSAATIYPGLQKIFSPFK